MCFFFLPSFVCSYYHRASLLFVDVFSPRRAPPPRLSLSLSKFKALKPDVHRRFVPPASEGVCQKEQSLLQDSILYNLWIYYNIIPVNMLKSKSKRTLALLTTVWSSYGIVPFFMAFSFSLVLVLNPRCSGDAAAVSFPRARGSPASSWRCRKQIWYMSAGVLRWGKCPQ